MRRWHIWIVQAALAVAVIGFVSRELASHWEEFRAIDIRVTVDVGMLALATLTVWATYAVLIEAWRRIVMGWEQSLSFFTAVHVWCLSNMGRYLPGKVWSLAGLAVLGRQAGVSAWAATGSALAMQALGVGTGASIVALTAPRTMSPLQLVVAIAIAVAVVWFLVSGKLASQVARAVRPDVELKPLPLWTALAASAATLLSWLAYGFAFWMMARGLLPEADLSLRAAIGVFAAGYIVGLLALFAPGGLGVREAVFIAILAPRVGGGSALALAVGSRLLMTIAEVVAALFALLMGRRQKEKTVDAS